LSQATQPFLEETDIQSPIFDLASGITLAPRRLHHSSPLDFRRFVSMKKALFTFALLVVASPAFASDNLLDNLGLSGLQVVTQEEATEVKGRGFVSAYGTSSAAISAGAVGDVFAWTDIASAQDLELVGLNGVEGLTGSSASIAYDISEADNVSGSLMSQGSLTVTAGTIVVGSAH
jgi:hypothetical protein